MLLFQCWLFFLQDTPPNMTVPRLHPALKVSDSQSKTVNIFDLTATDKGTDFFHIVLFFFNKLPNIMVYKTKTL